MTRKSQILVAIQRAKRALDDLAVPATLVTRGPATVVPGGAPTYSESSSTVRVVFTTYDQEEIDGDRIRASDVKGIVFPESGQPTAGTNDLLKASNLTYRVMSNNMVMAGDQIALSQLQLRLT